MLGGAYLCFEGFEKLAHKFLHSKAEDEQHHKELLDANQSVDLVAMEKDKIKGAVRTDFILSAEIIVIALGTVAAASFAQQVTVLVGIAVVMTIGVYGLVGAIVKMDDAGLYLSKRAGAGVQALGRFLLSAAPKLMKFLSVAGTVAMFMVGGGILTHGIPGAHDVIHHAAEAAGSVGGVGPLLAAVTPSVLDTIGGVIAGAIVLAVVTIGSKLLSAVKR
jgi:predicted DNA repair protein MutK